MRTFTRFHVLYKQDPEQKGQYWQITAGPSDDGSRFEVRMFGGDVIQSDPEFETNNPDAECYTHLNKESANQDADNERDRRLATGWLLHRDSFSR